MQALGYSGEDEPLAMTREIRVEMITSNSVVLSWVMDAEVKRNEFLRGFRVKWCVKDVRELLCKYQDFIAQKVPAIFHPELRMTDQIIQSTTHQSGSEHSVDNLIPTSDMLPASGLQLWDDRYKAHVIGLPETSRICFSIHVLNIRLVGRTNMSITLDTMKSLQGFHLKSVEDKQATFAWEEKDIRKLEPNTVIRYEFHIRKTIPPESIEATESEVREWQNHGELLEHPSFIMNGLEADTEYIASLILKSERNRHSSSSLIFRTKRFPPDTPVVPQNLSVLCYSKTNNSANAILTWDLESGASPQTEFLIEWVAGYNRTIDENTLEKWKNLTFTERTQRWINLHLHQARAIALHRALSTQFTNVPPGAVLDFKMLRRVDGRSHYTAVILLNADSAYHFRISSKTWKGFGMPSDIAPPMKARSTEMCYVPPQPVQVLPLRLVVYGIQPNSLFVRWSPIPEIMWNGPGLTYTVSIVCSKCSFPTQKTVKVGGEICGVQFGSTLDSSQSRGQIKMTNYYIWPFQSYEVLLSVENFFGAVSGNEKFTTGYPVEAGPSCCMQTPKLVSKTANELVLKWENSSRYFDTSEIRGFFRGFRVTWCPLKEFTNVCVRGESTRDYSVSNISKDLLMRYEELPLSGCMKSNLINTIGTNLPTEGPITEFNGEYYAILDDLPEDTRLKISVRVINYKHSGPPSEPILVRTSRKFPSLRIATIGRSFAKLEWNSTQDFTSNYTVEVLEVSKNSYSGGLSYRSNNFKLPFPGSKEVWIMGLEYQRHYGIAIRTEDDVDVIFGEIIGLRTGNSQYDPTESPFYIRPVANSLTSVDVCFAKNILFWNESAERNIVPFKTSFRFIIMIQSADSISFFMKNSSTGIGCTRVENLRPDKEYEISVASLHNAHRIEYLPSLWLNLIQIRHISRESFAKICKLTNPPTRILLRVITLSVTTGLIMAVILFSVDCLSREKRWKLLTKFNHAPRTSVSLTDFDHPLKFFFVTE